MQPSASHALTIASLSVQITGEELEALVEDVLSHIQSAAEGSMNDETTSRYR